MQIENVKRRHAGIGRMNKDRLKRTTKMINGETMIEMSRRKSKKCARRERE